MLGQAIDDVGLVDSVLHRPHARLKLGAHTVARRPECGIHAAADSNHHGESEFVLARSWQHDFTDQPVPRILVWKLEVVRERYRHVNGFDASDPLIKEATQDVREHGHVRPPDSLRDSHYAGAKKLGRGAGYVYPHDDPTGFDVDYLPDELKGKTYFQPSGNGEEAEE